MLSLRHNTWPLLSVSFILVLQVRIDLSLPRLSFIFSGGKVVPISLTALLD